VEREERVFQKFCGEVGEAAIVTSLSEVRRGSYCDQIVVRSSSSASKGSARTLASSS
jgi:hypothetical protein